jgi:hypothetical protein
MNGELAQNIALIAYGNEFFSAPQGDPPELFLSNSTFQYVADVSFTRETWGLPLFRKQEIIATDTRTWFAYLRAAGITRLRLATFHLSQRLLKSIPEHIGVAFAANGVWCIRADSGRAKQLWRARWSIKNHREPQHRIWSVEYLGISPYLAQVKFPRVDDAAKELYDALNDAKIFSAEASLGSWREWFSEAIELLGHSAPVIPYHPDLLPPGFRVLSSRQLLSSACKAWVFGGMGSWNDVYFEPRSLKKEYVAVTSRLYRATMNAIGSATNSTAI